MSVSPALTAHFLLRSPHCRPDAANKGGTRSSGAALVAFTSRNDAGLVSATPPAKCFHDRDSRRNRRGQQQWTATAAARRDRWRTLLSPTAGRDPRRGEGWPVC